MYEVLVGPGKAREIFLDEMRAHGVSGGMGVPAKVRSVYEPTNESQHL